MNQALNNVPRSGSISTRIYTSFLSYVTQVRDGGEEEVTYALRYVGLGFNDEVAFKRCGR